MKGKSPKLVEERTTPKQAEVVDLMARLRASLEGTKATGSSKKPAASKPRKASRSKREVA
jgi:non-homologous end joining protein Ku